MNDFNVTLPSGSLYLTDKEVIELKADLENFWSAEGTENIAMEGRQIAAILDYILRTKVKY